MVQSPTQIISLEDFLQLPETNPGMEYIDGQIYQKPMPQGKHSKLQTSLVSHINKWSETKQLAYGFTELRCTIDGRSIIPDISVFFWENLPLDENQEILDQVTEVPDWAIEILSPDQSSTRPIDNLLFLLNQGMSLGWLIDPYEKVVFAFEQDKTPITLRGIDPIPLPERLNQYNLTVNELFDFLSFSPRSSKV